MLSGTKYVGRASFCSDIQMGGGAVRTMISHMRQAGMIGTARAGTFLTGDGRSLAAALLRAVPGECHVPAGGIASGAENYAVLLRGYTGAIRAGLEQRDYVVLAGGSGAVTLVCRNGTLVFPGGGGESADKGTRQYLADMLEPADGDVVIIAAADDPFLAEISAKGSALQTIASFEMS